MENNYIRFKGLFRDTYVYIDKQIEEGIYEIDKLLDYNLFFRLKFKEELYHPDYKFKICVAKVKHKDRFNFENILLKLNINMNVLYGKEYTDFLKFFNIVLEELSKQNR